MSDQFDKVIAEIQGARKDINDCLELLSIASTVKKDCSDELNEIIQAALPFVNTYNPHLDNDMLPHERYIITVAVGDIRRLISAISKVTDGDLK